ncbi:hypothetical protein O1R50_09085 [Glycomyces luteolus]|uniref:Uncharacterized protein n=1 Tax=Glycomyces luteolus TaxID=2670330 RepID=A0A9X3PAL2_9ACTN|nr:hypothetical protein [Glycomyces luteolus]MDA1359775.1 hypothetical protein [Glycomyces luteolus]
MAELTEVGEYWDRPVRTFSPRSVPQLWAGLVNGIESPTPLRLTAAAIEAGSQMFFGSGNLRQAAGAVIDWHRQVLRRCRLYHFSAQLWAHALDCETDFPEWIPTRHDFPTPYGMVVFERPVKVNDLPISAFTYGPGANWSGEMQLCLPASYSNNGRPIRSRNFGPLKASWLVSVWTTTLESERVNGMGPLVNETDFYLDLGVPGLMDPWPVPRTEDGSTALARAFKIAFDLATQTDIATRRSEPVPRSLRKRAERAMPEAEIPTEVVVHDLRPRLAAAIGARGGPADPVERTDAHFRIKCWPVRPVLDPATGDLLRRGYIAYRDPSLLEGDLPEPAEVWRGTDFEETHGEAS